MTNILNLTITHARKSFDTTITHVIRSLFLTILRQKACLESKNHNTINKLMLQTEYAIIPRPHIIKLVSITLHNIFVIWILLHELGLISI